MTYRQVVVKLPIWQVHLNQTQTNDTPRPSTRPLLLDRAKSVVELDSFLDFGPWWYAPLLATTIGSLSLWSHDLWSLAGLTLGATTITTAVVVSVHDYRRRLVQANTKSARGAIYLAAIVILVWVIIALWGTAISAIGYDRFVPTFAAVGWVLTCLALLGLRAALISIRQRRLPLS